MSGYLQRLLDRAPPSAATAPAAVAASAPANALPAGPSLSPVALADQRLNDPALLGQLGLPPVAESGFGEAAEDPVSTPTSLQNPRRNGLDFSSGEPTRSAFPKATEPAPARADPRPQTTLEPAPAPELRAGRRAPTEIDTFDLLPPETEAPPAQAHVLAEPAPPAKEPGPPASPAIVEVAERPEQRAALAEPAPAHSTPEQESPTTQVEVEPPRPQPMPAAKAEAEPRGVATEIEQAARIVEVEPPPQREPAPLPPVLETRISAPTPTPAPRTDVAAKQPPQANEHSRETSAPIRGAPRTAAAASIIGPLPMRPRALTLFGLRRR
jgi:hypothetical protein